MVVRTTKCWVQPTAAHTLMAMGVVAFHMTRCRGEWKSGSQYQGSDGGGKDRTRGWMGQRRKEGDYEGMKGDGESISAKER